MGAAPMSYGRGGAGRQRGFGGHGSGWERTGIKSTASTRAVPFMIKLQPADARVAAPRAADRSGTWALRAAGPLGQLHKNMI
jgi:hypothetical protein